MSKSLGYLPVFRTMEETACPVAFACAPLFAALPWLRDTADFSVWVPVRPVAAMLGVSCQSVVQWMMPRGDMGEFHAKRTRTLARAHLPRAYTEKGSRVLAMTAKDLHHYICKRYRVDGHNVAGAVVEDVLSIRSSQPEDDDATNKHPRELGPAEAAAIRGLVDPVRDLPRVTLTDNGQLLFGATRVSRDSFITHWLAPLCVLLELQPPAPAVAPAVQPIAAPQAEPALVHHPTVVSKRRRA